MRKLLFILSFFCLLGNLTLQAKEYTIQEIPMVHLQDRTRYVSNPDGILSESAVATIDNILYNLEQKTGIQTLVVVVTGIEGGDCFEFAYRLGKEKGVGQKGRDNGLVILLSTDERCIQFATGYGLEGAVTDAFAKMVIEREMIPYFRQNDYFGGTAAALKVLMPVISGEISTDKYAASEEEGLLPALFFLAFMGFVVFVLIVSSGSNNQNMGGGNNRGGRTFTATDAFILGSILGNSSGRRGGSYGGGSFGGGFGGGGFGGFGGGSFGGGGAGGSW